LNIHQVVENARLLEERVLKQDSIIQKQTEQIDRLQETVYQLLGSTFCQATEIDKIYSNYNYMKWGSFCNYRWLYSEEEALKERKQREDREKRREKEDREDREDRERERQYDYECEEEFQGYESDPYDINFDHENDNPYDKNYRTY
jgi:hypothetical protein